MPERVTIEVTDCIAQVQLNRPDKRNALDLDMFTALAAAQRTLKADTRVRVIILGGAGTDFCSGLDVRSMLNDRSSMLRLLWKWLPWQMNLAQRAGAGWRRLPIPVIAAIQGRCWGGGLQIALGADFRIAQPDASLSIMEGKWGLIPDMGGTLALRELSGRDHAMRLAMTADIVDGTQAQNLGLVTELSAQPQTTALEWARQLAECSPDAVAAVKRLYRQTWHARQGTVLARETLNQWRVLAGRNQRIAVRRQLGEDIPFR